MANITTINPTTEEPIKTYELMSEEAAFSKVEACHLAFLEWRSKTHEERAFYLRNLANTLRSSSGELASLMTRETARLAWSTASSLGISRSISRFVCSPRT